MNQNNEQTLHYLVENSSRRQQKMKACESVKFIKWLTTSWWLVSGALLY